MNWWEKIAYIDWVSIWIALGNVALMMLLGLFVLACAVGMVLGIMKMFKGKDDDEKGDEL